MVDRQDKVVSDSSAQLNLHFQSEALGKHLLTDSCKPKNATQQTQDRWDRNERYKGGHWTQLRSYIKIKR